ncbi:MAG: class I SAM-dependent methyltransferase [Candidatus Sericytochromatia bacterium]
MRHNLRRLEHLASLRLPIAGANVLEVGAGIGDHSLFYLDRGCTVTAVEARPENCFVFREHLLGLMDFEQHSERVKLIMADAESLAKHVSGSYEIVHCYGLIYHLEDPAPVLAAMAGYCQRLLLLETRVSFGSEQALNPVVEDKLNPMEAFHGLGCRPTRPWVMAQLQQHFPHVYIPATQPAHFEFPRDWTQKPDTGSFDASYRAIFIASRQPLDNPLLLKELPMQQTRV